MTKYFTSALLLLFATASAFAQNNVRLEPVSGDVCNPMTISLHISGNSFNPVSYLWSTGETSPEIEIASSGTYTLTVTGYLGNSNNLITHTKSATYTVLPAPQIAALTDLWVCKGDTVKLAAIGGYNYDNIVWSNGTTGVFFQRRMNLVTPGTPGLDTMSVFYTATINNVCTVKSQTVMLRAIRRPNGVGQFYQGKMDIKTNDSIPAGLVTEYMYPVSYLMTFTEVNNPSNSIEYITAPGSRKAPASMLTPGYSYSVSTNPVINGKVFCSGLPSLIGIAASTGNRLSTSFTAEEGTKIFRVYSVSGQMLLEKQAEEFNQEWVREFTPQILIVHRIGKTNEVTKLQPIQQN